MGKVEEVVWRILLEKKRGAFARNLGGFCQKFGVSFAIWGFRQKKMIAQKLKGEKQSHEMPKLFYSIYKKSKFLLT
jgi:uncharacterized membrane-anchored protein